MDIKRNVEKKRKSLSRYCLANGLTKDINVKLWEFFYSFTKTKTSHFYEIF